MILVILPNKFFGGPCYVFVHKSYANEVDVKQVVGTTIKHFSQVLEIYLLRISISTIDEKVDFPRKFDSNE